MEHKQLWTNPTVTAKVKQLAEQVNLQPYYDDQERAIQQFSDAVVNDVALFVAEYVRSLRYIDDTFDFAAIIEERITAHYTQ
jgi:hypothetical protein